MSYILTDEMKAAYNKIGYFPTTTHASVYHLRDWLLKHKKIDIMVYLDPVNRELWGFNISSRDIEYPDMKPAYIFEHEAIEKALELIIKYNADSDTHNN